MSYPSILLVGLLSLGLGATASAGENSEIYKFKFADEQGDVQVHLDSAQTGFRLSELAQGESANAVTEQGQTVLVTRDGDQFQLLIDGREFSVPAGLHGAMSGHRVVRAEHHSDNGLTIIGGSSLDKALQQDISEALTAAGIDVPVHFVGGDDLDMGMLHEEHTAMDGEAGERHVIIKRTH